MKFIRYIFAILLAGLFVFLAYFLYNKQQHKYSLLSFRLKNQSESILVPNINRLLEKIEKADDIEALSLNLNLSSGLDFILSKEKLDFNEVFGDKCFLSLNAANYNIAFSNPDLGFDRIVDFLNNSLGLTASYLDGILTVDEKSYYTNQFGIYTVISNGVIVPNTDQSNYLMSNADYIVYKDSVHTERYILSDNRKFKVWNSADKPVRGNPTTHVELIARVPSSFQSLYYYGSKRFQEDKNSFFINPSEDAFSWVGDGFVLMKKDSFEVLLSATNDQRDLKLILEEQTLALNGDSVGIRYSNIKNASIMRFKSNFEWHKAIPELNQPLKYYTEFENFNLLSNNIDAMRWFLSEVQIGNLIADNDYLFGHYLQSTPIKSHKISIDQKASELRFEAEIWIDKTKCTHAQSLISKSDKVDSEEGKAFDSPFIPNFIQPFTQAGTTYILLSNDKNTAVYSNQGELVWAYSLPADLIQKPSIIDLQNDGKKEFAFFMKDRFIVLNTNGKPSTALSINLNQQIVGGLCANYDQQYDYRFFIITENAVKLYSESGQIVSGWTFSSGGVKLTGQSAYTQIAGKDYISFLGVNDQLFVLNRRGENRFTNAIVPKLKNESNFITGKNESDLHKLGYENQYIYMHYLKDGTTDSIKLDKRVNGIGERWIMLDRPLLLVEEPTRILLFNTFGYVEEEILKPQGATAFVGLESTPEIRFVFYNNSNNSLYLLDGDGKIILSTLSTISVVYGINTTHYYTFDGKKINEHNLN